MALDFSDTLVVGISATALFDLTEADAIFRDKFDTDPEAAIDEYRKYMQERESQPLEPGTGFPLVKALLSLNEFQPEKETPLLNVVVMSRNSPETGIRVFHNIREHELDISRSAFTGGESVVDYLDAYDVDLFLTTNRKDAQRVIDSDTCAVALVKKPPTETKKIPEGQVRIAFDGDAVLFSEDSEIVYKAEGLKKFHDVEDKNQDSPLDDGPYTTLLKKLSRLQERLPHKIEYSPVRIAIVTARNSPAEMRVINTLRHWGVCVDEIFLWVGWISRKSCKPLGRISSLMIKMCISTPLQNTYRRKKFRIRLAHLWRTSRVLTCNKRNQSDSKTVAPSSLWFYCRCYRRYVFNWIVL